MSRKIKEKAMDAQAVKPPVDERKENKVKKMIVRLINWLGLGAEAPKPPKKPMTPRLTRWSGLATMVAGTIFIAIQVVHPADLLASVTTEAWTIVVSLKFAMCFLFLVGTVGLYLRQANKVGWLALTGCLLFSLSWFLQGGYVFMELFVLPVLPTAAPQFVESVLGIVNSASPSSMNIGGLPGVFGIVGGLYLLGGLLFGIASLRARVFPRWPSGLLAAAAVIAPFSVLVPHELQRFAAVPMGIALIWLGHALYSQRQEQAS